jgi:hypothetical protein
MVVNSQPTRKPAQTVDDLSNAMMANGVANQVRVLNDAIKDNRIYQARMNAVCDAEAQRLGAKIPAAKSGEDDVNVFTNSPVTSPTPVRSEEHTSELQSLS